MPELAPRAEKNAKPAVVAEAFACGFHCEGRDAAWVSARGELDIASAPQFQQTVKDAFERALLVVIDLRALTVIDSTGLHAIIDADARAHQTGKQLVVIRGSAQVDRLFELVGLTGRLKMIDFTPGLSLTDLNAV